MNEWKKNELAYKTVKTSNATWTTLLCEVFAEDTTDIVMENCLNDFQAVAML
jgi:hypothetical protein